LGVETKRVKFSKLRKLVKLGTCTSRELVPLGGKKPKAETLGGLRKKIHSHPDLTVSALAVENHSQIPSKKRNHRN